MGMWMTMKDDEKEKRYQWSRVRREEVVGMSGGKVGKGTPSQGGESTVNPLAQVEVEVEVGDAGEGGGGTFPPDDLPRCSVGVHSLLLYDC